jgi:mono/diheme cytochrome c family protein
MRKFLWPIGVLSAVLLALSVIGARSAGAQTGTPAEPTAAGTPDPEMVKKGKYLVDIVGCSDCHTPLDPKTFLPVEAMRWAGGQSFDLGPAGTVYSRNLTSDPETGIGSWSDEQIKLAITQGVDAKGQRLYPVMPYLYFDNMADDDLDAIVAYLRTIPPIKNKVPDNKLLPGTQYPPVPARKPGIVAPDPKDTAARGQYLLTALLTCGDCHTPIDPKTGAPDMTKYFAGGQPFEGPWGVIYGGNITPDQKTGIASWTDDDIRKLIQAGVRPDGRVAVLMPRVYANLTDDDLNATIHYLRNDVKPVESAVPKAALNPGFIINAPTEAATEASTGAATTVATEVSSVVVTQEVTPTPTDAPGSSTTLVIVSVVAILVVGGGLLFFARKKTGGT